MEDTKSDDETASKDAPDAETTAVEPPKKLRKTRWGQQPAKNEAETADEGADTVGAPAAMGAPPAESHISTPASGNSLGFDIAAAAAAAREALEKAKKTALFRKQLKEQASSSKAASSFTPAPVTGPHALMKFDQYGRAVDDEGRVVPIKAQIHSTLKVNINIEKEQRLKEVFHSKKLDKQLSNPEKNQWYDPSQIGLKKSRRKAFRFIEQGSYRKREQQMLQRAEAQSLGIDIAKIRAERLASQKNVAAEESDGEGKEDGDQEPENANLIPLGGGPTGPLAEGSGPGIERVSVPIQKRMKDPTPEMEWWDMPLVTNDPTAGLDSDFPYIINVQKFTHYVEHPIPITPIIGPEKGVVATMHLTPQERAKLRRRKRQESEREKQDKIRMGLMPPPPPKVKLSNLMRALGDVAVADPSKVERRVRQQMEQRIKQHEARNEERKLTPADRSKKRAAQWQPVGAMTNGISVCAFAVRDLSNKRLLFKVDRNASQVHLTGACVICPNIANLVVVEGSTKSLKHFKRLILHRIKWKEGREGENEPDDEGSDAEENKDHAPQDDENVCLLWEGIVRDRYFKQWKVYTAKTETEARKMMTDRNSSHYWDMARRHKWPVKTTAPFSVP